MTTKPRSRGTCLYCGRQTDAKNRLHLACRVELDQVPLPVGRWVPNGRGIVVYRVGATGLGVGAA
jgi:hypothetical protein